MNQAKYIVYAFLLFLCMIAVVFLIDKTTSTQAIVTIPAVVDFKEVHTKNFEGKTLFSANCAVCHALNKIVVGPALQGVESRGPWKDRKNLIKWVKNSAAVVNQFEYTKDLFKQFNQQTMPSFPQLSDKQIESILDYISHAASPANDAVTVN